MNAFKRHVPAFCDGVEPLIFEFNTLEELLSNEWIDGWTKYLFDVMEPKRPNPDFYRFSLSNNNLMAEFKNGTHWHVVGSIKYPEKINLPKWEPNYKDRDNNNEENIS